MYVVSFSRAGSVASLRPCEWPPGFILFLILLRTVQGVGLSTDILGLLVGILKASVQGEVDSPGDIRIKHVNVI